MNFVNNWRRDITLAAGAVSAALDLPNGTYRLTLADAVPPTRFEIIEAVVANGSASLTRGIEGTSDQNWPAGSTVFASVTAGILQSLASSGGGGGGAAPIISDQPPMQAPDSIGQLYVFNEFETRLITYIASGTDSPENWVPVSGIESVWTYGYAGSFEVERYRRNIAISIEGSGSDPTAILVLPPWSLAPVGFSCKLEQSMTLELDFGAMGRSLMAQVHDHGTETTMAVSGAVLRLSVNQPVEISITDLSPESEINLGAWVALAITQYTPATFRTVGGGLS
ncbi:hypothetical protein [Pseudomonas sp. Marseille-QA0892]